MDASRCRIVRLETISHHELMRFIYVYNAIDPVKRFKEVEIYCYDHIVYYAAIIGRVVTLMKVEYD